MNQRRRLATHRWWVAPLVLLVGLAAAGTVRADRTAGPTGPPGPALAEPAEVARAESTRLLLRGMEEAIAGTDRRKLAALAAGGRAGRFLGDLSANVRRLRIVDLSLRYVDAGPAWRRGGSRSPGRVWVAEVEVRWRLAGFDARRTSTRIDLVITRDPRGPALLSSAPISPAPASRGPTPLWLLARLRVSRGQRLLVMAADPTTRSAVTTLAGRAASDVRAVLGRRVRLVVEVPATETQLNRVLDAKRHDYDVIAAVTAADRSGGRQPGHVVVNPAVFGSLGPEGRQIVLSHEAAHVATGASSSQAPAWLVEGFADYVALKPVNLPVSVAAGRLLGQVRRAGPPDGLPQAGGFDPGNPRLGASYEAAWLACRLLAERYGEQRLLAFYRAVDRTGRVGPAFRRAVGTTAAAFTRRWRAYLARLAADGVAGWSP